MQGSGTEGRSKPQNLPRLPQEIFSEPPDRAHHLAKDNSCLASEHRPRTQISSLTLCL